MQKRKISIIIPVHNEEESIKNLISETEMVMRSDLHNSYEIIVVDDASTDTTHSILMSIKSIRTSRLQKRAGQTGALARGIEVATGDIMVTLDGDGQNSPVDIPKLLKKLDEGYDVVCGWRVKRNDSSLRLISSFVARALRKVILNDVIHDSGCGLKAMRRRCFDNFSIKSGYHRFLPWIMRQRGFKVTEIKVSHYPRKFGSSKYGIKRYINGLKEIFIVKYKYR